MENSRGVDSSIGVVGLLGILFVALKLMGYITWSWWLVTIPFWAGAAIILGILSILLMILGIEAIAGAYKTKRKTA